jgi:CHRD domain/LPXTG cell wall anchor motif
MTRKTKAVIAVIAVAAIAALFVAPSAFAQQSSDGYGEDVYGGNQPAAPSQAPADSTLAKRTATSWTMLRTSLTGEVEVPPGDSSASGTASVKVSDSQVCFEVKWAGIKATASHIHLAPKGKAGAIVVPFFKSETPISATSKSGCTEVSATLAKAIANNPSAYYVNVHDTEFPKGAIRGQLAKDSGGGQLPYTGGNRSRGLLLLSLSVVIAGSMLLAAGQRRRRPVHARR